MWFRMRDFKGRDAQSSHELAQHVLAEVPTQLLLYMQQHRITPQPPRQTPLVGAPPPAPTASAPTAPPAPPATKEAAVAPSALLG